MVTPVKSTIATDVPPNMVGQGKGAVAPCPVASPLPKPDARDPGAKSVASLAASTLVKAGLGGGAGALVVAVPLPLAVRANWPLLALVV